MAKIEREKNEREQNGREQNGRKKRRKEKKGKGKHPGTIYEKHYNVLQNIAYCYRFYRENIPAFLWLCLMEIAFGAAVPYFGIYLPKLAVDLVTEGVTPGKLCLTLGGFGLLYLCVHVAKSASGDGKYFLYNTKRNNLVAKLFLKSLRIPYESAEEGPAKDLYWKAVRVVTYGDLSLLYRMAYGTVGLIVNGISFVLYSTVLSVLSPWMVLLLVAISFVQYRINLARIKYMEGFQDAEADHEKKKSYLFHDVMGNPSAAKDIRIFGMRRLLNREKEILLDQTNKMEMKKFYADSFYGLARILLTLGRDVFAYAYLIGQAAAGCIGAGEFVLYFGAITGFSGFVGSIMDSVAWLREGSQFTNIYRAYMELPEEDMDGGSGNIPELTYPISVEFQDVSFSYSNGSGGPADGRKKIFDHLNLKIRAGEKLAIVGVNGAGKTTLVKLLCGMYEPDEGKILINGIDRSAFSKRELYRLFSVVFQEKFLLPVTVGENLALSREYDRERAVKALQDAGLGKTFAGWKAGLDTFFDKDFDEDGLELSGGQEQRFLLARALYKDAPFLVLDEPTAALDPIAESEVYDSYAKYTEGKTALFISHRLASTRFSDRIILLGDGRILEEGNHDELMERGGEYARMFRVQSSYYAKSRMEKEAFA